MRIAGLLLLAACTHTATPVHERDLPRDRLVLAGEVVGEESIVLRGADGRDFRVAGDGRFLVSVPAGVYEVGGQSFSGIPGDVLYIGSIRREQGGYVVHDDWRTVDRSALPPGSRSAAGGVSLFAGSAHRRSNETPGRYQLRTGQPTRPLPGPGRAGQGIGLRGR